MMSLALILCSPLAHAIKDPRCPAVAEIPEHLITPAYLQGYLRQNPKVSDPGELLCCLPKAVRGSFVVGHNSDAAQSGNPHGPHLLFFPPNKEGARAHAVTYVLSLNGGGADLNNPLNVEMMATRPAGNELELFDISFEHKPPRMTKDPQDCINCHGSGFEKGAAGLHPNFQPFAGWSRFLGGKRPCGKAETDYYRVVRETARRALQTNPRYRCLDLESPTARDNFKDMTDTARTNRLLKRDVRQIKAGRNPQFRLATAPIECSADDATRSPFRPELAELTGRLAYDRFIVDTALRNPSGLQSQVRFLFEGRGISLANIDMDPVGGRYGRALDVLDVANKLVDLEPANSPLRRMRTLEGRPSPYFSIGADHQAAFCGTLSAMSRGAFDGPTPPPSSGVTPTPSASH